MGAILSTFSSQPSLEEEPSNPPLEETAPMPQSEGEGEGKVVGETQENKVDGDGKDEDGEEEEGECGFCLYMKQGGCRDSFVEWEKCVQEGEENKENIVEKCYDVTTSLKACMEANPDYYGPILKAEKAAEAEVVKELEKEEMKSEEANAEKAEEELEKEKETKSEEANAEKAAEELEKEKETKSEESKAEKAAEAEVAEELEKEKEKKNEESEPVLIIKLGKEEILSEKEAS